MRWWSARRPLSRGRWCRNWRDSVCQLDSDGSTTECTVKLSSAKEIVITAKNKLGQCVSLNCYANEIVVYDEVNEKRIGTYVKTK